MLFRWVFAFGLHRCGLFSSMVKLCGLKLGSHLRPKTELVVPTSPGESRAGFSPHHSPALRTSPPPSFLPSLPFPFPTHLLPSPPLLPPPPLNLLLTGGGADAAQRLPLESALPAHLPATAPPSPFPPCYLLPPLAESRGRGGDAQ